MHTCMRVLTHTHNRFMALLTVRDNWGEPEPEETFTHSHLSWSSVIPYLLSPSITICGILPVQFTYLTDFFHNLSKFSSVYLLAWHPQLHTPYISSSAEVPPHFAFLRARCHFHALYYFAHNCCIISLSLSMIYPYW